jgi:uncharacterized RDD family membrane protein YckC/predicted Zn-dependent protease
VTFAAVRQRLFAWAIDFALWLALVLGLGKLAGGGITRDHGLLAFNVMPGHVAADLAVLVGWLYCAGCESSAWQATLGKRLVGIAVIDENGERISFLRASCRHFSKVLSALPFLIGFLITPLTPRKQALHDLISRSLVVDAREVVPAPVESVRVVSVALVVAGTALFGGMALMSSPSASVYVVPLGQLSSSDAQTIADDVSEATGVQASPLDGFDLPEATFDAQRGQFDAEVIEATLRRRYANLLNHDKVVIGVTTEDMYTSAEPGSEFVFSRDDDHLAVVSLARMAQAHPLLVRLRADTMVAREVGVLHFHEPLNDDPSSILFANVQSVDDIDRMAAPAPTS